MTSHLSDKHIEEICNAVDRWDPAVSLTWEALVEVTQALVGRKYSRQALCGHERIKNAYKIRRNLLRNIPERSQRGAIEIQALRAQCDKLKAQNERLRSENDLLLSQFARWVYNASLFNLTQDQLNRPLPSIDRERSSKSVIESIRRGGKLS